ncbi:MAG TPA: hypothetical protein VG367_10270 [Mucilaginibacter sp.]|jgi:hypothetical protein|nr:hypothetical protein [Mucilaginibacter sp.]
MEYFDEINKLEYLFLVNIKDLPANRLLITIKAATISDKEEDLMVGDKNLGPVRRIESEGPWLEFELFFQTYGAYSITNESFSMMQDNEERVGRLFCVYSKSNYLDYIRNNTIVDYTYDYNQELKHYGINCQHHTIDIVTISEPIVKRK